MESRSVLHAFFAVLLCTFGWSARAVADTEYHVSVSGADTNDGTTGRPFRTIAAAAQRAMPGDTITVHQGVYRERISPPRGGESDTRRIVYRAAEGESVEIKGSEVIKEWEKVQDDTWKVSIPNAFFGEFNPYSDSIRGDWFEPKGREHHTGAVYLGGRWLMEAATLDEVLRPTTESPLWFGKVDGETTSIWGQFKGVDPNAEPVEINVRQAVFYPEKPGMDYITVRGFKMCHAATPWAPPTAEQVGLVGTHWSKGWIIEANDIGYSKCAGIALGKYGDQWDNTSANTAEGYVLTIDRALENGWSSQNIGHHVVRNNTIAHCEQAGIVGSLGAIFSTISGNTIHDIHVHGLFTGAEMAGIKIHGAIDTEICRNRIFRTVRGIWLDWMAQGTRVTQNLLYQNASEDLFVEVNHGPFVIDNNVFLSERALLDMSEGGAYIHNLFAGGLAQRPELTRSTPFHKPHSTEVAGLQEIEGGDDRFHNNIFVAYSGLAEYDKAMLPMQNSGNVFLEGAKPSVFDVDPLVAATSGPTVALQLDKHSVALRVRFEAAWRDASKRHLIASDLLRVAKVPQLGFLHPDDSLMRFDTDYFGSKRDETNPFPGPFELSAAGEQLVRLWPRDDH